MRFSSYLRKILPSKYQRIQQTSPIIVNMEITVTEFTEVMQRALDAVASLEMER